MSPTDSPKSIVFSSFRLDLRGGRLMRGEETIPLRPKTWAVLVYLAQRPGVLVTKEQLLDALWADVAVTPDTLTKSIGELRLALGDDAKEPRCIETVHRRGFRFVARVGDTPTNEPRPLASTAVATASRPFVGRDDELRRLESHLAKAHAGERQIVFVTGSAGMGKTALVEAFLGTPAVRAAAQPLWVGRGACVEHHGPREAYMPVLEAFERLAQQPDSARLVGLLRRTAPTWLAQIAWLIGDDVDSVSAALRAGRTERMLLELAVLSEALTTDVTLLLVLEDLHWSDPSTVDLLGFLAQRQEPARLLVVATYRPAEVAIQEHVLAQIVRTLRARRRCAEVPVHDLTSAEVDRYLEARFPGSAFPPALSRLIHTHTDGNPLFMVSIVDHMLARGWILDTAPGWALSTTPERIDLGVPDDVRRMIEVQFEILGPADRDLLDAASVAGIDFAPQLVAAALGASVGDAELRCETLARANRFLRAAGRSEWPDGSVARRYAFIHELYRQVVYAEVPDGRRQLLHQRIGEALESAYGERALERAPELVAHFEKGRDQARLLRYLRAAAARDRQRFANREAYDYLAQALALTKRLSDPAERLRHELEVRTALAPILSDLHGFASEAVRENAERAYALCAEVGSPEQSFQILYALCQFHAVQVDPVRLPESTAQLAELARRIGKPDYLLLADTILERCAFLTGRFAEAGRMSERRLAAHRQQPVVQPFAYGADALVATNCQHAQALWFLGYGERARAIMQAAVAAASESDSPFTRAAALGHASILALFNRQHAEVGVLADQVVSLSAEHGFPFWHAMALAMRGWAWIHQGELRKGIEEVQHARAALQATGARLFSTHILAFLAEGHLAAGDVPAALEAVEEALVVAQTTLDRMFWPELWRLKGDLLLTSAAGPERREGDRCLQRALDMARKAKAKALELRAATSRARAWQARGRIADGHRLLDGVCGWFGDDEANPDLIAARALLAELAPTHAPARAARTGTGAGGSLPHRIRRV